MLEKEVPQHTRESALRTLLAKQPGAVVAALSDSGFRIPLPDHFPRGERRALEVPPARATMLDVVVSADRIAVVTAWERARRNGLAVVPVHPLHEPETRLTLTMVDARESYGVWLGLLTRDDDDGEADVLPAPLVVPSRPRQATLHKSMTALITSVDSNATAMLGWSEEQMLGQRSTEFIHPEDQDRAVSSWMQLISTMQTQRVRLRHRCADGSWLWLELEHVHNGAEDPDAVDVVGHISDISDEMAAHEALRRREQLFRRLAESLPTGVLQLAQDGSAVFANARLGAILQADELLSADDLFARIAAPDRASVEAAVAAALQRGEDGELEVGVGPTQAGRPLHCSITIAAVSGEDGEAGALICVNDVTESARLREELRVQATRDPLTGCLNRSAVMRALSHRLARADGSDVAVVFVDIDRFKPVNDLLGHASGDEVLLVLVRRLESLCRPDDLVGRLGGDEFVVICSNVSEPEHASRIAARVRDALNQPVTLSSGAVDLRASIGVARSNGTISAETLVARADAAMYESKRAGTGTPVLYTDAADAA
jgi:diguanylate cyclase (GGDEF)-like protein/PAS domain S-box-containing protein